MANRQGIITALKTQLATITILNGYNTDLGNNVKEWYIVPADIDDFPFVEIRDESSAIDEFMNNSLVNKILNITITAFNSVSSLAGANARLYILDILKAISTDLQLSNNAYQIDEVSCNIEASQDSEILIAAIVNISVYYQTNIWSD